MSSNTLEKKKSRSKNSNGNVKKSHPRIDAIKVTVERKKKCNDKALQIVTDFSEGTISEESLLDNLKFINQEHYQDIIEERAINKLCGYPLCSKILKNIPQKQYHISTTLNKVFDITERKNFCSNLCFKASKFLKDQISTSPLWLREDDSTSFTLISLQSNGGMTGDEVDLGVSPVKLVSDEVLSGSTTELNENSDSELATNESSTKERHEHFVSDSNINSTEQSTFGENKIICSTSKNILCNNNSPSDKNKFENVEKQDSNEEMVFGFKDENLGDLMHKTSAQSNNSEKCSESHNCQASDVTTSNDSLNSSNPRAIREENQPLDPSVTNNNQTQNIVTESHKHSSKRKSLRSKNKSIPANTNPIQNVVLKIEQILRDWISLDSLCFVLGEEKIKEILAEKKDQNLPAFTQDVHFYERYLAICKKLNILELEDTKVDTSYRDEARKPLPDYEALKEEARQMEIKVKMFFKGDKVRFEDTEVSGEVKTKSEAVETEPVLPLVDVHAQKALRRRIVIDKLRKVLQDLQKSLGLRGFNLTEDLRTLVSTLTLSAHNITMKPAEWNLVAIAVIKLLSLRDSLLAQALTSSVSKKHLTLLLMSYSLDSGYVDRLMVWLTDVEAVLQKT